MHPLHPPAEYCDCLRHDLARRAAIQAKASELSARFRAREEAEWVALKLKSVLRPEGVVIEMKTRRVRKVEV